MPWVIISGLFIEPCKLGTVVAARDSDAGGGVEGMGVNHGVHIAVELAQVGLGREGDVLGDTVSGAEGERGRTEQVRNTG